MWLSIRKRCFIRDLRVSNLILLTLGAMYLSACSLQAKLMPTEQASLNSLKILSDSGPILSTNKSSYHIRGLCPVGSASVEFQNSVTSLPCNSGVFEGDVDLSAHPDGPLQILVYTNSGQASTWNILKDTIPPIVNLGAPTVVYTGLNKNLVIPVTLTDADQISTIPTLIDLSGTGINDCTASWAGTGTTFRQIIVQNCSFSSGSLSVKVLAGAVADQAGNSSLDSNTLSGIIIDNIAPGLTQNLTSSNIGNASSTFRWELNFTGADLIQLSSSDLSLTGASAGCTTTITGTGLSQRIVEITGCSSNGSLSLSLAPGVAKDLANNSSASLSLTGITIDNSAPILSLSTATPTSGNSGTTFNWTLDITGADSVNLSSGNITLSGTTAGCSVSVSGSGLTQRLISVSGCTGTGTLGFNITSGIATDISGNLSPAITSSTVTVSNLGVTLSLSNPSNTAIRSTTQSQITLTYANANSYSITTSDITINGASAGCTKALSGSGPTFTLTIANCTGNGTITVSVAAGTATDGTTSASAAGPSANILVDNTAPTIAVSGPSPSMGNSTTSFSWILNFTDASSVNLTTSMFNILGDATGCVKSISGTGLSTRTFSISGCTGSGSLDVALDSGAISDSAGNSSSALASLGSITLDNTAPSLTIGSPNPSNGKQSTTFIWPATFTGANSISLNSSFISLTTALSGCNVAVTGTGLTNRNVEVTNCSGEGTLKISINAAAATDLAGNTSIAVGPSTQVIVDNTAPTVTIGTVSPSAGNISSTFSWPITFSGADISNFDNSDVQLNGTATAGCVATVSSSGVSGGTVNVTGCSGTGTLSIKILAGAVSDFAGNSNLDSAVSGSVTVNNIAPAIQVSGLPIGHDSSNSVTTTVSGVDLINYYFKIGAASSTDCSNNSGYSSAQALGAFNHDFSSLPSETIKACFKGQNSYGTYSAIYEHQWSRVTSGGSADPATFINICGNPVSLTSNLSTTSSSGILVDSGGSSANYINDNEVCTYTINTGAPITINLELFSSESGYDFLEVYDGTLSGTQLARISGVRTGNTYTANSGTMTLKWTTDSSVRAPGFIMAWGGATSSGADFDPDVFAFSNITNPNVNTQYSSSTVINGISGTVVAGVSGFDAEIRNISTSSAWGPWTTVQNGQTIGIRMTSGATTSEVRTATIKVGTRSASWKIYWDAVAPTGSISIAGGAAVATTPNTTLDLTYSDSVGFGAQQMYITQDASCTTAGSWESYTTPKSWTLQNESAANTVYVRFKDEAGNISPCYSDSINQDNQMPPVASLTSTANPSINLSSITVDINFNEPVTGLSLSDFIATNATVSNLTGSGKVYAVSLTPIAPGTFSVYLPASSVKDNFNNDSVDSNTLSRIYDNIAPGVTLSTDSLTVKSSFILSLITNDTSVGTIPAGSFNITNGSINFNSSYINGSNKIYSYTVTPASLGNISITMPANSFTDMAGNFNTASNTLTVEYRLPPVLEFESSYSSIVEGAAPYTFNVNVKITQPSNTPFSFRFFASALSTAQAGVDYNFPSGTTVNVAANATSVSLPIEIIGNSTTNGDKVIVLGITGDSNSYEFNQLISHTVLIKDDEFTPNSVDYILADYSGVIKVVAGKLWGLGKSEAFNSYQNSAIKDSFAQLDPATTYVYGKMGDGLFCGITTGQELRCAGWWASSTSGAGGAWFTTRDSGVQYKQIDVWSYMKPICGVTTLDKIRCRGSNTNNMLLIGAGVDFTDTFVDVDVTRSYKKVATLRSGTICGITTSDELYCWGKNNYGQAGNGTTTDVGSPTLIDSGTTYKDIFSGFYADRFCGITSTDKMKCWGYNNNSIGLPTASNILVPTIVDGTESYKFVLPDLSFGGCAITTADKLKCWTDSPGYSPIFGQSLTVQPIEVLSWMSSIKSIAGEGQNFCVVNAANEIYCRRPVQFTLSSSNTPADVNFLDNWNKIGMTTSNIICGITVSGITKCSSSFEYSASGTGITGLRNHYLPVLNYNTFVDVSVEGSASACGVGQNGKLYCWGDHVPNKPFKPSTAWDKIHEAYQVSTAPNNLVDVETTGNSICVLTNDGTPYCSGKNYNGSFGVGNTNEYLNTFVTPNTSSKFTKLAVQDYNVCGITTTQSLECWGNRPGNGTANSATPVTVLPGTQFKDVSANLTVTCAITTAGQMKCWGMNDGGMGIGNNDYLNYYTPVDVDNGTTYKRVHMLYTQAGGCGITSSDQLKCWGSNTLFSFNYTPTLFDGGVTVTEIYGGGDSILYKKTDGQWRGTNLGTAGAGLSTPTGIGLTPIPR